MSRGRDSITLLQLVLQNANAHKINSIESSFRGSALGQKNFKGKWQGYRLNNSPTVSYRGKSYNIDAIGYSSLKQGTTVNFRTGKNYLGGAWR
tara:strand:- start:173 stop:451 length:279 start_codon:yes stop_codon:yes gene_type:complete